MLWFAGDVPPEVPERTSVLGEAGGGLLWYLLATVACNGTSVASNPETFSILFFCCETLVAASSLSSLHPLPSWPFSPVQVLAAPVKSPSQKVSRTAKRKAAYAQILRKMYVQFEGGRERRMPVLHIPLLSPLEANTALLSML